MVLRFLAVAFVGLLLLAAIRLLFDHQPGPRQAGRVSRVETLPDIRTSGVPDPNSPNSSSALKGNFYSRAPDALTSSPEPDQSKAVPLSIMKVRLQSGAAGLQRIVWFDPSPLDQQADVRSFGSAEVSPQSIVTEPFQASRVEGTATASASPDDQLAPAAPQQNKDVQKEEQKAPDPETAAARTNNRTEEASATAESVNEEQVLHIKSRLHDLGFLSLAKNSAWDAGVRSALRDFKVANSLSNDGIWDIATSEKLFSQTAVPAHHSIVGNWSTGPCRSAKPSDIRLSINSQRARSSAGSVCEFRDLKVAAREWRVKATCSQKDKRWNANGRFSLSGDKLVWASGDDVISYFRCN